MEKMENIIAAYTLPEAIADGVLYPVGWAKGLPVMVTAAIKADLPAEEQRNLFDSFFTWERDSAPSLPDAERMFTATASNGQNVWVINDGAAITLLYPSDY
ncbi:MAG: hypothetical protein ACRDJW_25490 [Thermomicrobiales bacterium]